MNDEPKKTHRGIRMAIKVTAISVGATAALMAATATAQTTGGEAEEVTTAADAPEPLKMDGWSCISRGPLAPPAVPDDFDVLLGQVPA